MFRNQSSCMLGIDRLVTTGNQRIESTKNNFEFQIDENKKVFQRKMDHDWLIQLMCQYSGAGRCLRRGDFIYYYDIMEMIRNGNLYLSLLRIDNWAFPDKEQRKNYKNITDKYKCIKIENDTQNYSDGIFSVSGKLSFSKLYETEESTPQDIPFIEVENLNGYVEFGTQTISKTAQYLISDTALLRVPYEMPYFPELNPVLAIFINIDKFAK